MRDLLLVVATPLVCFAFACGGEVIGAPPTDPNPNPSPNVSTSPPPSEAPPPSADQGVVWPAVPAEPAQNVRTDLNDPAAAAICTERDKIAPKGSFTADATFGVDKARDVSSYVSDEHENVVAGKTEFNTTLRLYFPLPAVKSIDPKQGPIRTDHTRGLELIVRSSTSRPDAFAAGTSEVLEYWENGGSVVSCSATGGWGTDEGSYWPPGQAKITITSRSATTIEGTIEVTEATGVAKLTFKSPLNAPPPQVTEAICCLK